ncbi:spore coat protein GerQ [Heyndrickxia shackletonii]|uniref:Spore coat protein GerQ n=1 Tax=Heyndrickxia shackletonii TaxID=157838 RepID=A0A0Q3WSC5_9BACI|nr:spore coat protein GerQ [Heyndrickxia shackletonii]KQL51157.1 spore coat protein GerQ [Heyndrickxia shackletonii]
MSNSYVNPNAYGYPYRQASQPPYYGGNMPQQFGTPPLTASGPTTQGPNIPGMLPAEQSYIENILRLNKGKLIHLYATFENKREKQFTGIIEAAGRDHVIISDPQTGERNLIPMVYVDYITFTEEVEYEYPFGSAQQMATYPTR